ncbi:unnamed protein product [Paramecium sonneborni]|uniref:Uncharacterized protein n=1 Tax=Paramecium sonneborni TaxID=65129 RepID=A0A8S1JU36_9CILI|nr:unnamed protein product [Paramecium sonneborni]
MQSECQSEQESFNQNYYQKLGFFKCDSYNEYKEYEYKENNNEECEIDFEQASTYIVNKNQFDYQVRKNINEDKQSLNKKIRKQSKKDRNLKDYKKNICRNILRHAIKSMNNDQDCLTYLSELVDDSKQFSLYYNRKLEQITGFRVLRDHLLEMKEDNQIVKNRKLAFKYYLIWYLKSKATGMILRGETHNPQEYLRYKNEVLMYYIHRPHEWISNSPEWVNVATSTTGQQFQLNTEKQCI